MLPRTRAAVLLALALLAPALALGLGAGALTPATSLSATAARVVVADVDTGINLYHSFYYEGSEIYPAGSPPASVTPELLAELGIDAAHQVQLTRTGNYAADKAADTAIWTKIHNDRGSLWWFKGTNVIATSKGATGANPILDDDGHGTGTSSAVLRANPEAVLLFIEGAGSASERFAFQHPAVDIVTTSYGVPGSIPLGDLEESYAGVVGRGKLHFGAADNSPSPAMQDGTAGPWWAIGVTGYEDGTSHGRQVLAGTFADFAADYKQTLPYCTNCETGMDPWAAGTSFATPQAAGAASKVVLEARRAAGHAGGIDLTKTKPAMVVTAGGILTNWDIRRALEEAAYYPKLANYNPVRGVLTDFGAVPAPDQAPWLAYGWGVLDPRAVADALAQLNGTAPVKGATVCDYMTKQHETRHRFWDQTFFLSSSYRKGGSDPYKHC